MISPSGNAVKDFIGSYRRQTVGKSGNRWGGLRSGERSYDEIPTILWSKMLYSVVCQAVACAALQIWATPVYDCHDFKHVCRNDSGRTRPARRKTSP